MKWEKLKLNKTLKLINFQSVFQFHFTFTIFNLDMEKKQTFQLLVSVCLNATQ